MLERVDRTLNGSMSYYPAASASTHASEIGESAFDWASLLPNEDDGIESDEGLEWSVRR